MILNDRPRVPYYGWGGGVAGPQSETTRLRRNGFHLTTDCQGNVYYVPEAGPIIHLYPNGTWASDYADATASTLMQYLAVVRPRRNAYVRAMRDAGLLPRRCKPRV